jgi:hypothetical protein
MDLLFIMLDISISGNKERNYAAHLKKAVRLYFKTNQFEYK